MLSLMVLGAAIIYFIITVGIALGSGLILSKFNVKYAFLWGIFIYLLINIPLMYKTLVPMIAKPIYCKKSGFTLYKTPKQWKLENPGVAETLKVIKGDNQDDRQLAEKKWERVFHLNQRFDWTIWQQKYWNNIFKTEEMVVDVKTKEVMARRIDYGWGLPLPFKGDQSCFDDDADRNDWIINGEGFTEYKWKFEFLGEQK